MSQKALFNLNEKNLWQLALNDENINFDTNILYLLHGMSKAPDIALLTKLSLKQSQQIAAILEISVRLQYKQSPQKETLNSPLATYKHLHAMARLEQETIRALYLDSQLQLLRDQVIAIGTMNVAQVHLREILRPAFLTNAYTFILAHNHPSGESAPSEEDVEFTRYIINSSLHFGIPLQDHLIISSGGFISMRQTHSKLFD